MSKEWTIKFYTGVENDIREMPVGIRSRMVKLLEVIQIKGPDLGEPMTKPMGKGLFEIRAKGTEGIGRSLFCYQKGRMIVVLYAFVKKTQKTPKTILEIARQRQKEIETCK
ncbi:type II toxin-antitoxin system RelE/ParE family toxin [Thiomicrospira microaerophila]|uniref:type II toxin-antitoxin system RelE/ParE family toxin n=1 Tax=Thiomicrospira microaerophila TaxID=406020 RepID=UPI00200FEE9B|nr:type II toxin-antitoxin system RelE/ParE family toxin [Thiomicrospira microaerophila]UQB42573.1 type II toxin-antitoxin system RelE/ParE family toxin [Thiomicrospira microaerophila]